MLAEFLGTHRDIIIADAQARALQRKGIKPTVSELTHGIPVFFDQLRKALQVAEEGGTVDHDQMAASAGLHGGDLLRQGLTVRQVVQDYGAVCQAITELATRLESRIEAPEFQTLNLCLDDATAAAVTEFGRLREGEIVDEGTERLGILAHELRNLVTVALLTYDNIKSGRVAIGGSTGAVLGRSLLGLRDLLDLSLAEVRLDAGIDRLTRIRVAEFIEEVDIGAQLKASSRGLRLTVGPVEPTVTIEGDRQVLAAALSNLLQNAFKFTRKGSEVSLTTLATATRVLFEVEDECGGLPPGKAEALFRPFEQRGADLSGVGLGLSICLKAAKANGGELRVRDLPGKGCVFTLDLPRREPPPLVLVGRERGESGASEAGGAQGKSVRGLGQPG